MEELALAQEQALALDLLACNRDLNMALDRDQSGRDNDLKEGCRELARAVCTVGGSLEACTEWESEWEQALVPPHRLRGGNAPGGRAGLAHLHAYEQLLPRRPHVHACAIQALEVGMNTDYNKMTDSFQSFPSEPRSFPAQNSVLLKSIETISCW